MTKYQFLLENIKNERMRLIVINKNERVINDIFEFDTTSRELNWISRRVDTLYNGDVEFLNKDIDFGKARNISSKLRKAIAQVAERKDND